MYVTKEKASYFLSKNGTTWRNIHMQDRVVFEKN